MPHQLQTRIRGFLIQAARHRAVRLGFFLAIAAFLVDWASKSWALRSLEGAPILLGSLTLEVARNEALAFSVGHGYLAPAAVVALRLGTLLVLILVCARLRGMWSYRNACGLALIFAGGLGNAADLVFRGGGVVDFIGAGPLTLDWADQLIQMFFVFNVADLFILIGVGLVGPLIHDFSHELQGRLARWENRILSRGAPPLS